MTKPENIDIPINLLAGWQNQISPPETTFTRHMFEDYAHLDLFIGKTAHHDISPYVLGRLQPQAAAMDA